MSETPSRVVVLAGALTPPGWLPAVELVARLPALAALIAQSRVAAETAVITPSDRVLATELAHDTWLRGELAGADSVPIAAGAMTAVRRLALLRPDADGWLLQPAHFHLARDHVVLDLGATATLDEHAARRLIDVIRPTLEAESLELDAVTPTLWLLRARGDAARLQLRCASPEAANGRNITGYLPEGPDARRYRRLLNEIQMAWFAQADEAVTNGVWLSGPLFPAACKAWADRLESARVRVDERFLAARLNDDRHAWLAALASFDASLRPWIDEPETPSLLLCGEASARWLRLAPSRETISSGLDRFARFVRFAGLVRRSRSAKDDPHTSLRSERRPRTEALFLESIDRLARQTSAP